MTAPVTAFCINATDDAGSYDAFKTNGVCSCSDGWGDVGCDKNLTRLTIGRSQTATVPVGEWAFFDVVVEAPPATVSTPRLPCSWSSGELPATPCFS